MIDFDAAAFVFGQVCQYCMNLRGARKTEIRKCLNSAFKNKIKSLYYKLFFNVGLITNFLNTAIIIMRLLKANWDMNLFFVDGNSMLQLEHVKVLVGREAHSVRVKTSARGFHPFTQTRLVQVGQVKTSKDQPGGRQAQYARWRGGGGGGAIGHPPGDNDGFASLLDSGGGVIGAFCGSGGGADGLLCGGYV